MAENEKEIKNTILPLSDWAVGVGVQDGKIPLTPENMQAILNRIKSDPNGGLEILRGMNEARMQKKSS